jgi:perosamine synthetase
MSFKYPVYKPHFTGKEKELVQECLDSTWISSKGKYINEFETRFASYLGTDRALSVSNGTVALHVALEALGIGPGDEVLVPTLTYIASANAVSYVGARVVFVDSEPDYWQIDTQDAERKITKNTKAIMPVHLYGHACDMDKIQTLAKKYSLYIIEDCAEAIGTKYKDKLVGGFGDIASFSFFGNKTITTGEGGMVVTNNDKYADLVARLKGQGLAKNREYWHDIIGYNYRMTNICAAIGCAQMDDIEAIIEKKSEIADWYRKYLSKSPIEMHGVQPGSFHSYWMVSILTRDPNDRDLLREHLKNQGIETRPLFNPVHKMDMYLRPDEKFPVAENLSARGINLPSYPDLTRTAVEEICTCINEYFGLKEKVNDD